MMIRALWFSIAAVSIGFASHAQAQDACDIHKPCIDARGVEVSIRPVRPHGIHNFSPNDLTEQQRAKLDGGFSDASCPNGICACDEQVDAVQFGQDAALNAQFLEQAKSHQCSVASSSVYYLPLRVYARPGVFSSVIYNLNYCQDCGGSCHGNYETATYTKDKPVAMSDIVDAGSYAELKKTLLLELKETDGVKQSGNDWSNIAQPSDAYLDRHFWSNGFFIEDGRVRFNFGEFLFGCAGGSFNPVDIPEKFIHPEFLALLKAENQ